MSQARIPVLVALTIMCGTVLGLMTFGQTRNLDSVRDQVITNTQRLNSIERALDQIQTGTNTTQTLAIRVSVMDSEIRDLTEQVMALRQIVYGSLTFAIIQFTALVGFGLKAWFTWMNQKRTNG